MATVTAAVNAQSVGTGSNVGNGKFGYKLTKQAASTTFKVEAKIVTGTGAPVQNSKIIVHYAASGISMTADEAIASLRNVKQVVLRLSDASAGVAVFTGPAETFVGDYAYLWVDQPTLDVAGTLTVNFNELP